MRVPTEECVIVGAQWDFVRGAAIDENPYQAGTHEHQVWADTVCTMYLQEEIRMVGQPT